MEEVKSGYRQGNLRKNYLSLTTGNKTLVK